MRKKISLVGFALLMLSSAFMMSCNEMDEPGVDLAVTSNCGSGGGATVCLSATAANGQVVLNWSVSGTISSPQIYRDTDSNPSGRIRVATVSTSATSYTATGLTNGVTYWFWVKFTASGSSYSSGAASATPSGSSTSTSGCGTSNGYPICCNSSSDPDGDGWGWENSASCVVVSGGSSSGGSTSSGSGSCPSSVSCPSGMSCGCYIVSGLGSNKKAYASAGAGQSFLASAMMETEKSDTNYAYGDNKTGDAFNAGACKQNWGMLRVAHSAWKSLGANDYKTCDVMNSNRALDVQCYNESRSYYGTQKFFAGHRNGSSGLANPNTTDINNFVAAYNWTYSQIASHMADDVRFWVSVPAI